MTTWHIVPTGISILRDLDDAAEAKVDGDLNGDRQALHQIWKASASNISAERGGLLTATNGEQTKPNLPDDRIIFLASDTEAGQRAARLNAVCFDAGFVGGSFGSSIPTGQVVVLTITDLEPADTIRFRTGMANLARFFTLLSKRVNDERVIIHLSGGFKATIPYLIKLTELLMSSFAQRDNPPTLLARIQWEGARQLASPIATHRPWSSAARIGRQRYW